MDQGQVLNKGGIQLHIEMIKKEIDWKRVNKIRDREKLKGINFLTKALLGDLE